jgi:sialic acid synthase SpsE
MISLYANISMGHENDWETIKARVVAAAQCNADAIIISKATPQLQIPEHKKYVSIESKWGNLAYIDVAKRSEIDELTVKKFNDLTDEIGIPVIWSVTDSQAVTWVKDNTNCENIKIHFDAFDNWDTWQGCGDQFSSVITPFNEEFLERFIRTFYKNKQHRTENLSVYHTTIKFPPTVEELNLNKIEQIKQYDKLVNVGYEGRCAGLFPDCAVVFKTPDYIEKFLGDPGEDYNEAILTPKDFYDFFVNMNQLEIANG